MGQIHGLSLWCKGLPCLQETNQIQLHIYEWYKIITYKRWKKEAKTSYKSSMTRLIWTPRRPFIMMLINWIGELDLRCTHPLHKPTPTTTTTTANWCPPSSATKWFPSAANNGWSCVYENPLISHKYLD